MAPTYKLVDSRLELEDDFSIISIVRQLNYDISFKSTGTQNLWNFIPYLYPEHIAEQLFLALPNLLSSID